MSDKDDKDQLKSIDIKEEVLTNKDEKAITFLENKTLKVHNFCLKEEKTNNGIENEEDCKLFRKDKVERDRVLVLWSIHDTFAKNVPDGLILKYLDQDLSHGIFTIKVPIYKTTENSKRKTKNEFNFYIL